jgi:hypothetical protein
MADTLQETDLTRRLHRGNVTTHGRPDFVSQVCAVCFVGVEDGSVVSGWVVGGGLSHTQHFSW